MFTEHYSSAWLAAILVVLGTIALKQRKKNANASKSIPGSSGWPFIGHLPYMRADNPYPVLESYVAKYGPIFQLKLGSWDAVFVTDYQQIKRMLNTNEFAGRPQSLIFKETSLGGHGIISSNGDLWVEQRRFALRHLRDLGIGKSSIETHIHREISAVLELLNKSVGEPIDLNFMLNIAILDIIWAVVAGSRLEYDDPKFTAFMEHVQRNTQQATSFGLIGFLPWITKYLPERLVGIAKLRQSMREFFVYAQDLIKDHRKTFDENDPRDYIDHFLLEQSKQGSDSNFTDAQLMVTIGDFFAAGGETTATTLRWAALLISSHPEVQKRLQKEIDQIIGEDRLPNIEDQQRMPYTSAVIYEVQRFADIAPLGLPHTNEHDVEFEGFFFSENSMIIPCAAYCHRNPKYWTKPYEFYPEHFLDETGKLRTNVEGFIPFLTGKRKCLGEAVARVELFMFVVSFFQKFNFTLASDPKPTLNADPRSGLVRLPSPFKIILEAR